MDISQIKKGLAKLSFISNYRAFILPIILFVAFFIPLGAGKFMSIKLKNTVEKESIRKGKEIKSLGSQKIARDQWKIEAEYMDKFAADAALILNLSRQASQRELLSYKIFPAPKDTSVLIFKEFGQNFRRSIDNLITKYRADRCPTEAEINKAIEQSNSKSTQRPTGFISDLPPMAMSRSRDGIRLDKSDVLGNKIVNYLCVAAAKKASFYADVSDIPGYEYWNNVVVDEKKSSRIGANYEYESIQQSVEACWYWQVGYWIIEDIFKSIEAMNSNCANVTQCPVKRLVSMSFGSSDIGRGGGSKVANPPAYVTEDNRGMTTSYTQRVSNENLDVVHFRLKVIVRARSLLEFMEQLCSSKEHTFRGWFGQKPVETFKSNQITVLKVDINPVIKSSGRSRRNDHRWYRYGNEAVVELDLVCEYIFEREGFRYADKEGADKTIVPDSIWNRGVFTED